MALPFLTWMGSYLSDLFLESPDAILICEILTELIGASR